ncbi:MAG: hypothetical protein FE043_03775 [Thermoplasmata archaeon]|nr:MAG: hypothetical protein FE043_03775 [Thermoplasmata archaeon]
MIEKEIADIYSLEEANEIKNELLEALHYYRRALKVSTPDKYPKSYALVHNNIGLAYVKLAYFTNDKNDMAYFTNDKNDILKAIRAYEEALKIRTAEEYPEGYATTQNNLGTAYVKLAYFTNVAYFTNDKNDILKAIRAYEEALKIRTAEEYPIKYFLLQKALGDAYYQLSFKENRKANRSKAFDAYQQFMKIESYTDVCRDIEEICQEVKDRMERIKEEEEG